MRLHGVGHSEGEILIIDMVGGHSELFILPRKRGFNETEKMGCVRHGWRSSSLSKENIENR